MKGCVVFIFLTVLSSAAGNAGGAEIEIDYSKEKRKVSNMLYGIFFEDINHASDGGLCAQLIQNCSFEAGNNKADSRGKMAGESWYIINDKEQDGYKSKSSCRFIKDKPLFENNTVYAALKIRQKGDGIANSGYGGIPFEKGKAYPFSVYLRSIDGGVKSVSIKAFTRGEGEREGVLFQDSIEGITSEWKKYTTDIIPCDSAENGQLGIFSNSGRGRLDIDYVSLFRADIYKGEANGFRSDLAEHLEALHPAFLRFPGGCIVHGKDLNNRYRWKDTIGNVEERKAKTGFWGYEQSYGIGFYEYFRFCEDIGAEPIPVISVGMAHNGEVSAVSEYKDYAKDALDMIEWAIGDENSKWGRKRAEAGHKKPFKLNYIALGNEDCGKDYFQRFSYISKAIKEKYPAIKTILSSGVVHNDISFYKTYKKVREWEEDKEDAALVDAIDEHYYESARWFLRNITRYDDKKFYKRAGDKEKRVKVFIGEYAALVNDRRNNLYSALIEASYMTGLERNGDVILGASYAPLFGKAGCEQWYPNLIWFNNTKSYVTPNYLVQQLFSLFRSDYTLSCTVKESGRNKSQSAIGGTVGIGNWASAAEFKDISIVDNIRRRTIYDVNDEAASIKDWKRYGGVWHKRGAVITQSSLGQNVRAVLDNEKDMEDVKDYTFSFKARKIKGDEGFLVMFAVKGDEFYSWNIGGYTNTLSCVERGTIKARTIACDIKPIHIESGKWYDVKVLVSKNCYTCILNGEVIHEGREIVDFDSVYAHAGEKDGSAIIKIVNISGESKDVNINMKNAPAFEKEANIYTITGGLLDENSFDEPNKITIKEGTADMSALSFGQGVYCVSPYSVNVLVLHKAAGEKDGR